jgi:CRISPR system Cascade subunit CasE
MAFPSKERRERDREFLQPYAPRDFGEADVHVPRSQDGGFLFRIDPRSGGNPMIVVQSAHLPDWEYAFHNAQHVLAFEPAVKLHQPQFSPGELLRFRLKANTARRASERSCHSTGGALDRKWIGKRIPVPPERVHIWLERRAQPAGFRVAALTTAVPGYAYFNKNGDRGSAQRLNSVLFDGLLEVTDPQAFAQAVQTGIGPAKAYGFGLLSLAPLAPSQ